MFLLSLYGIYVFAVDTPSVIFAGNTPNNFTNISGTILLQLNVSDGVNFTNVTFFVMNYTNSVIEIGVNTSQNQTRYFFNWNTNSGSFRDDINYRIMANGTNVTGTSFTIIDERRIFNVTIDNTPPVVTFVNDAPLTNPDETDFITSTTQQINFSASVVDAIARHMTGPCLLKVNPTNNTQGGILANFSVLNPGAGFNNGFQNNTIANFTLAAGNFSEGVNTYRVECRQNPGTNITGNSTVKTLTLDLNNPMINITLLDINEVEQTQFGAGSEIKVKCLRADTASGANSTEIFTQNPVETALVLQKRDTSLVSAGSSLQAIEFVIPSTDTFQLGTYLVGCDVRDRAGFRQTRNVTFEILKKAPSGSSAYVVPGFKEPIAKTVIGVGGSSYAGDLTVDGLARLMSETAKVSMNIDGQEHSFTVTEIGEGYVMLEVASDHFEVRVNEGETKQVDVDADGLNDLNVNLNMIYKNKADLVFTLLAEQTPVSTTPEDGTTTPVTPSTSDVQEGGFSFVTLFVILIILILLAFVVLHFMRKKDRGGGPVSSSDIRFTARDLGMQRERDVPFGGYNNSPGPKAPPTPPKSFY
jgi:hypothetical protein